MANIKVKLDYPIKDGITFTFHAPCNCSDVDGIVVQHSDGETRFAFKDAHGNDLTGLNNLFTTGSMVMVVLDVTNGAAFLQNADTNGYLENQIGVERTRINELVALRTTNGSTNYEYRNDTGTVVVTVKTNGVFVALHVAVNNLLLVPGENYVFDKIPKALAPLEVVEFDTYSSNSSDVAVSMFGDPLHDFVSLVITNTSETNVDLGGSFPATYHLATLSIPEITDIRVDHNGIVHETARAAINAQFAEVTRRIVDLGESASNLAANFELTKKTVEEMASDVGNNTEHIQDLQESVGDLHTRIDGHVTVTGTSDGAAETIVVGDDHYDGFVDYTARADIEDLKKNGLGDPLTLESDGLGTIKIAKAKATEEPDEPDTPVEPDEPELDPHTLSGAVVTLNDADAVGLPLEITASADATKVYVGGKNLCPENNFVVSSGAKTIVLDVPLPAGGYVLSANTGGVVSNFRALNSSGTVITYSDEACTKPITTLPCVDRSSYAAGRNGNGFFTTEPIAKITLWANNYEDVCLVVATGDKSVDYSYAGDYRGGTHNRPLEELTLEAVPTVIFDDKGGTVEATYYTPAEPEEPEEPVEPEEPIDSEYTYVGEAKVLIFGDEWYDSFPDKKAQKDIGELGVRVGVLEDLVEQGGGTGGGTSIVTPPDYYFTNDYLPNKVETINTLMKGAAANGDAFIFITDQHTEQNKNAGRTPALLRYLSEHTKVRRLFSGGDLGLTQEQQVSYHAQMEQAFAGDIHYVMGNHEYDMLRATDADLYYIHDIHKPDQIGNAARHYYYVDNPQQKIRYVVVNNWESKGVGEYGGKASDLDAQAEWLTDTAFNVETGWGIIVFCHQFFNDPGASAPSGTATAFMDAIDNYTGAGEVIAVFHGHIHADMVNHTASGVPVIGVTADKTDISMETKPICTQVNRTAGTITEQAFDVVIVDRTARQLHCVRIGAPAVDGSGAVGNDTTQIRVVDFRAVAGGASDE